MKAIILLIFKSLLAGSLYNFVSMTSNLFVANFIFNKGKKSGLICGLGISLAHTLWSTLAIFALSLTFVKLKENQDIYILLGSLVMFYFAYKIYRKERKQKLSFLKKSSPRSLYVFLDGLFLGLSSPSKILGYAIIFSTLGMVKTNPKLLYKTPIILGVFLGSFLWWLFYTFIVSKYIHSFTPKKIRTFQKIAAFALTVVGVLGLIQALKGWR